MQTKFRDAAVQTDHVSLFFIQDSQGNWTAVPGFRVNEDAPELRSLLSSLINNNVSARLTATSDEGCDDPNNVAAKSSSESPTSSNSNLSWKEGKESKDSSKKTSRIDSFSVPGESPKITSGISFGQLDDLECILNSSSKDEKPVMNGEIKPRRRKTPFRDWSTKQPRTDTVPGSVALNGKVGSSEAIVEPSVPSPKPRKTYTLNVAAKEFVPKNYAVDEKTQQEANSPAEVEGGKPPAERASSVESDSGSTVSSETSLGETPEVAGSDDGEKKEDGQIVEDKAVEIDEVEKIEQKSETAEAVETEAKDADVPVNVADVATTVTGPEEATAAKKPEEFAELVPPVRPKRLTKPASPLKPSTSSPSKPVRPVAWNVAASAEPKPKLEPRTTWSSRLASKATDETKAEQKPAAVKVSPKVVRKLLVPSTSAIRPKTPPSSPKVVPRKTVTVRPLGAAARPIVMSKVGVMRPPNVPKVTSSSLSLSSNSTTSSSTDVLATKRKRIVDEEGWEMVKGRSRSRYSPLKSSDGSAADITHSMENLVRRGSVTSSMSVRPRPIGKRFLLPSGAVSLPSVVVIDDAPPAEATETSRFIPPKSTKTVQKRVAQKAKSLESTQMSAGSRPKSSGSSSSVSKPAKKKLKPKKSQEDLLEVRGEDSIAPLTESREEGDQLDVSQRVGNACASLGDPTVPDMPRELNNPDADAILDAEDDEELKANEQAVARVVAEEETLQEAIRKSEAEEAAERAQLEKEVLEDLDDDRGSQNEDAVDSEKPVPTSVPETTKRNRQRTRGFQLHEKLSSPSRKVSAEERMKRHEEKQAKANELRLLRLQSHKEKMEELKRKIEEVRATKCRLLDIRRMTTERKLKRAEEKRKEHIQNIVMKAHDEDEKVKEIAFINTLEAANKRREMAEQEEIVEARLQEMCDERQRKNEEKAAKEAAVEERRKALEAERQAKIDTLLKKREDRARQIAEGMTRKEELRMQLAREKAKSREERVSAINAKHVADAQKLQKKIALKHEESARRHEEKMDDIRRKAFESTVLKYSTMSEDSPSLVSYETAKMCTLCQVIIGSEIYLLSHLKGKLHRAKIGGASVSKDELGLFNLAHIVDAPDDEHYKKQVRLDVDRQKACRKRCGKIKHRLNLRSKEFTAWQSSLIPPKKLAKSKDPDESKFVRCVKEVEKLVEREGRGTWEDGSVACLERNVTQLMRMMKLKPVLKATFGDMNGFATLMKILGVIDQTGTNGQLWIPARCLLHAAELWLEACEACPENCFVVLYSDAVVWVTDHIMKLLNKMIPEYASFVPGCTPSGPRSVAALNVDPLVAILIQILTKVFAVLRHGHLGLPSLIPKTNGVRKTWRATASPEPAEKELAPFLAFKFGKSSSENGSVEQKEEEKPKKGSKGKKGGTGEGDNKEVEKTIKVDNSANDAPKNSAKPAAMPKLYGIVEEITVQDAISYVVALGIVDKVAQYIACVQAPIDGDSAACWEAGLIAAICSNSDGILLGGQKISTLSICKFVRDALDFVTSMTKILSDIHPCPITPDGARNITDPTNLVPTIQITELVSSVSLLYVLVVHQQSLPTADNGPLAPFTNEALEIVFTVTNMLNAVARLHPYMIQNVLGSEGLNLQFRHIASFLLWYCTQWKHGSDSPVTKEELLHSVIWLIGYFAVGNTENQNMIQSGQMPSVLHQLCSLPLPYFMDNSRKRILYPTLIACTLNNPANTEIVEEEVTEEVLKKYLFSDEGSVIHLIGVIKGYVQVQDQQKPVQT